MLYFLHELDDLFFGFNLFRYAEFRAAMAAATAFLVAVSFGRWFIRFQRGLGALERADASDSDRLNALHTIKRNTPTMGGVILILAVVVSTILWARPSSRLVYLLLVASIAFGALGFIDDWIKLRRGRNGLRARTKLVAQLTLGALVGLYLWAWPVEVEYARATGELGLSLFFPFFKDLSLPLGIGYVILVMLVITGTSNAVNLTDGLDGLATGCTVLVAVTFVTLAFVCGHAQTSAFLQIPHVPGGLEVAVFTSSLVGAGLGFLWFNCHPAQIFMGDTGALALGGALGLVALICKQEFLLVLAGGVLVAEALSVVIQVLSFKLWRRRVFLIAPLHHHFQFLGWAESKVTVRFWIVAALLAVVSLVTLKIR